MGLQATEEITFQDNWRTGSLKSVSFEEIINSFKTLISEPNHLVIVGSDSHYRKHYTIFASAITVVNKSNNMHSRYFYNKSIVTTKNRFGDLFYRVYREMEESLSIANKLKESIPELNIEIHLDVSSNSKNKTYKFSNGIKEIVASQGYSVKIKPNAWGATAVADKHTKNVNTYALRTYT